MGLPDDLLLVIQSIQTYFRMFYSNVVRAKKTVDVDIDIWRNSYFSSITTFTTIAESLIMHS